MQPPTFALFQAKSGDLKGGMECPCRPQAHHWTPKAPVVYWKPERAPVVERTAYVDARMLAEDEADEWVEELLLVLLLRFILDNAIVTVSPQLLIGLR